MKDILKNIYRKLYKAIELNKVKKINYALEKLYPYLDKNIVVENTEIKDNYPKYIWQLWFQGENNAPLIVKKCLKSVKKYCPPEYKVIVLDNNTIEDWIEVSPIIKEKYNKGIINHAHYSDYIRTCLLAKYGGIWIDATVMLTDNIPQKILDQYMFCFKNNLWYLHKTSPSIELFNYFLNLDNASGFYGSNWFLLSVPNNPIFILLKEAIKKYWQNNDKLCHYFMYHILFSLYVIENPVCKLNFDNMISLSNREPHLLQSALNYPFDKNLFEEIKKMSPIHKLTYKFDRIIQKSFLDDMLKNSEGEI